MRFRCVFAVAIAILGLTLDGCSRGDIPLEPSRADGHAAVVASGAVATEGTFAAPTETTVRLDIRPGTCPNHVNPSSQGLVAAAILGGPDVDVTAIDASSLLLEGVAPRRVFVSDPSSPGAGMSTCDCAPGHPDGFDDLVLEFRSSDLAPALSGAARWGHAVLTITGQWLDGTSLSGADCVVVNGPTEPAQPCNAVFADEFDGIDTSVWSAYRNSWSNPTWDYVHTSDGVLTVDSGPTRGGGVWMETAEKFLAPDGLTFEVRMKVDGLAQGDENDHVFCGLFDVDNSLWYSAAFDITGSGGLRGVSRNGGTPDAVPIPGVDVTQWHDYRLVMRAGRVDFFVDDALRASYVGSNVPNEKQMLVRLDKTSPGYDTYLHVDRVGLCASGDVASGNVARHAGVQPASQEPAARSSR